MKMIYLLLASLSLCCLCILCCVPLSVHAQEVQPNTDNQGAQQRNTQKSSTPRPARKVSRTSRRNKKLPGPKAGQPRPDPNTLEEPINPEDWRRENGTVPMWVNNLDRMSAVLFRAEFGIGFGGEEQKLQTSDPQRLDFDLRVLHIASPLRRDYRFHDKMISAIIRLAHVWNAPGLGPLVVHAGPLGTLDFDNSMLHVLGLGLRVDTRHLGVEVGFDSATVDPDGEIYGVTPFAGLRLGEIGHPIVALYGKLPQLHALASTEVAPSVTRQILIEGRAELPINAIWSAQVRGKYRDMTLPGRAGDPFQRNRTFRDASLVMGAEVGPDINFKIAPVFFGVGIKEIFTATVEDRPNINAEFVEYKTAPTGTQVLFLMSLDLGFYGTTSVW